MGMTEDITIESSPTTAVSEYTLITMTFSELMALAKRLRDHAAMHDTDSPHDDDQQQWRLVPVTPTPEMLAAVSWPGCAATDYAHMLAAAPQPPSAQPIEAALLVHAGRWPSR